MSIKIIEPGISRLDEIVELFDAYRVWYRKPSEEITAREFLSARLEQNESVIYAAENEAGSLVGFTQLYPLFSSTRMKRLWLLNDLFVAPEFRGRGISKQLIDRAKSLATSTDACGLMLETEKSNEIGNKLYPRCDFELETDVNFYFWKCPNQ